MYVFTDAYADQFAGPMCEKFKYKQLWEIIDSNSDKPMEEQKNSIEKSIEDCQFVLDRCSFVNRVTGIKKINSLELRSPEFLNQHLLRLKRVLSPKFQLHPVFQFYFLQSLFRHQS